MKNIVIVALMASAASLAVWALPPNEQTTVNYCPPGGITSSLDIHTNMSYYTYTSGEGCVISADRRLSLSGRPLQYSEPNNTAPVTTEFVQGRVEERGAIVVHAPLYGFLDIMVPWIVRIVGNTFERNAVLHLHGCLPVDSVVTISGNTFKGQDQRNSLVDYDGIAAISVGVLDPEFTNPLHFAANSQFVIEDNTIEGIMGSMTAETSGIRFVPQSFFLADKSKLVVRKNKITATGTSSTPCIPYNLQGYINVIPEYDGNRDVTFEFSDNEADVENGVAWWLPGMWGPRGSTDLKVNILRNKATVASVNSILTTERLAAIQSTVNCTARGQLTFEGNDIEVSGGEATLVFYEQVSEDHSVRIVNNRYRVSGGKAKVTVQPWWSMKTVEFSGNDFSSASAEVSLEIASINGTNIAASMVGNKIDGTTATIGLVDVLMTGGKFNFDKTQITSRSGEVLVNIQNSQLSNGAEVQLREWVATAGAGVTLSFPTAVNLENSKLRVRDSNLTSTNGNSVLNFGNAVLTGAAVLEVTNTRITADGGNPHLRFTGELKASDEAAVQLSFNTLYRTDRSVSMTMPFVYATNDVVLENSAEFGMWNNTFDARNNTNFVGLLTVAGEAYVDDDTYVHICNNKYFIVTNQTLMMMVVAPGLAERVDCSRHVWTPGTTLPGTTADPGTQDDTDAIVTPNPDDTATTVDPAATTTAADLGRSGAPAGAAVGVAAAAILAALVALLQ